MQRIYAIWHKNPFISLFDRKNDIYFDSLFSLVVAEVVAPVVSVTDAPVVDAAKAEPVKKFSFKALKKVGPIRLVKGFRASALRPKLALDTDKEAADSLRKHLFERRNRYEKFVETVLGKASPVSAAKQPAPGAPVEHDQISKFPIQIQ